MIVLVLPVGDFWEEGITEPGIYEDPFRRIPAEIIHDRLQALGVEDVIDQVKAEHVFPLTSQFYYSHDNIL